MVGEQYRLGPLRVHVTRHDHIGMIGGQIHQHGPQFVQQTDGSAGLVTQVQP